MVKKIGKIGWYYKYQTRLLLLGIVVLSTMLRFFDYGNRWGLAADQARDVLVAKEALALHTLPLIGPFSASGPYVFGPYWYWFLMIPIGIFPHLLLAPWISLTMLHVLSLVILFFMGRKLVNTRFGLILSLVGAISPAAVKLSTNLIMSSFVGVLSIAVFYFFIRVIRDGKVLDISIMSLLIGVCINTHFEAIPLTLLLVTSWIKFRKIKPILCSAIFFTLPFVPLALFSLQNHFYEVTHIFLTNAPAVHISIMGKAVAIIKKEIQFFCVLLPTILSQVVLGYRNIIGGYILFTILGTSLLLSRKSVKIKEEWYLVVVGGGILVVVGAYGGVIFSNFLAFIYPLFFLAIACGYYLFGKKTKILGISFLVGICIAAGIANIQLISTSTNTTFVTATTVEQMLSQELPSQKFVLYQYATTDKTKTLALALLLEYHNKISGEGTAIGYAYNGAPIPEEILFNTNPAMGSRIYKITPKSQIELKKEGFSPYSQYDIYQSVENWYKE